MTAVYPELDPEKGAKVVVLERVEPGITPDYHACGKVTCYKCEDWCWLGTETFKLVTDERVCPLCQTCAAEVLPPEAVRLRNANDAKHH